MDRSRIAQDEASQVVSDMMLEGVGQDFMENCEPAKWLAEEYKLLSAHYFHEDNYFQQSVATFSTLNSGLVAFYASDLVAETRVARWILPGVGILLSIVWLASILRTRERRKYAESRIAEIETVLHRIWHSADLPFMPLDIGTRAKWHEVGQKGAWGTLRLGWIRNLPASLLALILPPTFIGIWVLLFLLS